jgi:hypothetical protein
MPERTFFDLYGFNYTDDNKLVISYVCKDNRIAKLTYKICASKGGADTALSISPTVLPGSGKHYRSEPDGFAVNLRDVQYRDGGTRTLQGNDTRIHEFLSYAAEHLHNEVSADNVLYLKKTESMVYKG